MAITTLSSELPRRGTWQAATSGLLFDRESQCCNSRVDAHAEVRLRVRNIGLPEEVLGLRSEEGLRRVVGSAYCQ